MTYLLEYETLCNVREWPRELIKDLTITIGIAVRREFLNMRCCLYTWFVKRRASRLQSQVLSTPPKKASTCACHVAFGEGHQLKTPSEPYTRCTITERTSCRRRVSQITVIPHQLTCLHTFKRIDQICIRLFKGKTFVHQPKSKG